MQLVLQSSASKVIGKICCLVLIFAYVGVAVSDGLAYALGSSNDPQSIQLAITLNPSDAVYRNQLGQYFMFAEQRPDLAIPPYQSAVTLNPHVADYWLELANAYSSTGARDLQVGALERALEVDPHTPIVSRQVANAFLIRGDLHKALGMYRLLLQADPEATESTLEICWQETHDIDLMSEALPPTPSVYLEFLNLLISEQNTQEAEHVWSRLIALDQPFDPSLATPYIEYLIAQGDFDHARAAWESLGRIEPGFRPYLASAANLVVNGGFEEKILNMGFDWRYVPAPHAVLALDTEQYHSGARSLLITFDGEAVVDTGLSQLIPVDENTRYGFSAYAKADDISAAQGPQFVVSDANTQSPLLLTEELLGTTSWRQLGGSFKTGPHTNLVSLKIVRPPGAGRITGKLWIDDVIVVSQ
jgi:hypothetical protein